MGTTKDVTISENTGVRIGLITVIVIALGGCFAGALRIAAWGATMQTKLDSLITFQIVATADSNSLKVRVEKLEQDNTVFKDSGSPALRARIDPLEKKVERLEAVGSPRLQALEQRISEFQRTLDQRGAK